MPAATIDIGGRRVNIRRLTVGDIHNWLENIEKTDDHEFDLVTELAGPEGISLRILVMMSDIEMADVWELTAGDLDLLTAAAKKANPHFFRVWAAVDMARKRLTQNILDQNSPAPSAP